MSDKNTLFLATRKGLAVCSRRAGGWKITSTHFDGVPVTIAYEDERNGAWWACLSHGHWGVKLHRSFDRGANWEEVAAPAYPEGAEVKEGEPAATQYLWAMQHGGHSKPGRLWLGTIPGGLFRSDNGGDSFELVESLWNHPSRPKNWFGGGFDHPGIHSIVLDPRDDNHLYIGISCAGVFESLDGGQSWMPRNKGMRADYLPDPHTEVGHDPHLLLAAPSNPDVLWQQNHCGIFVSTDRAANWADVSETAGPARFGFAIAIADDNPYQAWVAPALSDEKRVAIGHSLCICRTDDGGQSWQAQRNGLPQEHCYDIIYRHALAASGDDIAFGTTTGNAFFSTDRGDSWQVLSHYLPMVHAVRFAG
ncbi:MAG: hypothetical protein KDC66_23675 [Phaeodactylibacter sp.]|nr:hypothetical protein [Phaeodactylibacter sp.]MCB9275122.1 glycosyl hydrolase [Lewinellaceae bacterium]